MNVNNYKHNIPADLAFHKSINNCQKSVPVLLDAAYQWLLLAGVRDATIINIQIVLAEALNNVIEHGYPAGGTGSVSVDIIVSDDIVTVEVSDDGMKFIPPETIQTPLRDTDDLDQLPEGGFGWFLIREITSSCIFNRLANTNHLIMKFN